MRSRGSEECSGVTSHRKLPRLLLGAGCQSTGRTARAFPLPLRLERKNHQGLNSVQMTRSRWMAMVPTWPNHMALETGTAVMTSGAKGVVGCLPGCVKHRVGYPALHRLRMTVHLCHPSPWEAKAEGLLWVQGLG